MSLSTDTTMMMPVAPTGMNGSNGGNNCGWGNDGAWWIIILFLFAFAGGWGNNRGNNGNGSDGSGGSGGYAVTSAFDNVDRKLDGVNNGLCDGFYAMNTSLLNGFSGVNQSIGNSSANLTQAINCGLNGLNQTVNNGFSSAELSRANQQAALVQQLNNMAMSQQNCCCENREAIQGVNYNLATQTNALQSTMCKDTRDIIENANANSRAILDYLCQDKISTLQSENQSLKLAASQQAQNATLQSMMTANTNEILSRTAPLPVPAYQVANPYTGSYAGCGCNCGCSC